MTDQSDSIQKDIDKDVILKQEQCWGDKMPDGDENQQTTQLKGTLVERNI